jgi:MFS family permease
MKEINKIYLANFFMGVAYSIAVIDTLYRLSNGLSQTQIALLSSLFFISYSLLEIPTGGLADTFGHKKSVFWGLFVHALAPLIVGLSPTYPIFLIGSVLAGLGIALQSGAFYSLIHDILIRLGKGEEYIKVQGRTSAYLLVGTLVASPLVSILYSGHPQLTYLISSFTLFLAAALIYLVKWEFKGDKPSMNVYLQKITRGITLSFANKRVLGLIILGSALFFSGSLYANNINQPLQITFGVKVALLGIIAAVFSGFKAIVSVVAYKFFHRIGSYISLLLSIVVTTIAFLILSQINSFLGLVFMLLLFLMASYKDQIILTLLQKEVSSEERSTMISTYSFLTFIIVGIAMPLGGYGIDVFGMKNTLIMLALVTLVFGLVGLQVYSRAETREKIARAKK